MNIQVPDEVVMQAADKFVQDILWRHFENFDVRSGIICAANAAIKQALASPEMQAFITESIQAKVRERVKRAVGKLPIAKLTEDA